MVRVTGWSSFALLGLAAYLLLWPVPIAPVAWEPPPAPESSGPYAVNALLSRGERLLEGLGIGPEDVAFDEEGRLHTGFEDGRIVRLELPGGEPVTFADTGGRPLGMVFDDRGRLIVADALQGLLSISPGGDVTTLVTGIDGRPFGFPDDLDIAPDGTIYFTDASTKFGYGRDELDLMEHGGHGRLLAYDPDEKTLRVVLDGMQFANGVTAAADGSHLLVAETGSYRIHRVWLRGPLSGTSEVFADNLPGFPDNISLTERGTLWVALASPRLALLDRLGPWPFARKLAVRLPSFLRPRPVRHGLVLELDASGRPLRSLQDASGGVALVSSVMERDGSLYLGSYREESIVVVALR